MCVIGKLLAFCAETRDVYLAFKALNLSQTGYLTEEEFMDVYSVSKLKWKVSCYNDDEICWQLIKI